jgi:hypothetical protein
MMNRPLTVTASYGTAPGCRRAWSCVHRGTRRQTYAYTGARVASPVRCGAGGGRRPAGRNLMWNNPSTRGLPAIPRWGRSCHAEPAARSGQLTYIANHAADDVIVCDDTLVLTPRCCPGGHGPARAVTGPPEAVAAHAGSPAPVFRCTYRSCWRPRRDVRLADLDELPPPRCATPAAPPGCQGRGLQPPVGLPSFHGGLHGNSLGMSNRTGCPACPCSTPTPGPACGACPAPT